VRTRKPKTTEPFHSGLVSILGRPNTGKSTILNALVGQKLAAVADKPQTTRTAIQGVLTTPHAQAIFLDTPGIHQVDTLFNRKMMESIREALADRDLLLFVVDVTRVEGEEDATALELVKSAETPTLAVLNKIDRIAKKTDLLPVIEHYRSLHEFGEILPVSALTGEGMADLHMAIQKRLPEGPKYFPDDFVTDQPERFLAAEIVREKILARTRQEVPHAVAVLVEQWQDTARLLRISATVYVERPGQKAIVIGPKGARLRDAGADARLELEEMFGKKIFLELFVKVQPGWRENAQFLKELDWRGMAGGDSGPAAGGVKEDNGQ
jgi:GTPase